MPQLPGTTTSGLTHHYDCQHREFTPAPDGEDEHAHHSDTHPEINGQPCNANGDYLPPHSAPPPLASLDGRAPGSWAPFESRTAFDFAHFHFVQVQSSASVINTSLDLWAAPILKYRDNIPWKNAGGLYSMIDTIQHGDAPWKVHTIRYQGPWPAGVPPKWMTKTYELCTRDACTVLHNQLATADFKDQFSYSSYRQFNVEGKCVGSNLMSGDWAWKQADTIARLEGTRGSMFIPVIAGSDKTTVSVATGHQEYHPVYTSPGNLMGAARRAHGRSVLPVAFLPIPKMTKRQQKTATFQRFVQQMYHACLMRVFEPLKAGMTTPEVVQCPDGHFCCVVYGLGPYIAEQVWLACVVVELDGRDVEMLPHPPCDARPDNLDAPGTHLCTHQKTDFLITCFDPVTLWDDFGIRSDVVPFMRDFSHVDIYELLSLDLLHQIIKGTFKDHLVEWVNQYLHEQHGEARTLESIADIDHQISAVPSFPGLRRFPDGRDFNQWTGDDSKALMKVQLSLISSNTCSCSQRSTSQPLLGTSPPQWSNASHPFWTFATWSLVRFYTHHNIFIATGVRVTISLPQQHSMVHYLPSIILFGSPKRLCSSITESKHIKLRYKALIQMLRIITRLDRLAALRSIFTGQGMMQGTTSSYAAMTLHGELPHPPEPAEDNNDDNDDGGDAPGPKSLSSIQLACMPQWAFPKTVTELAIHINQPRFLELLRRFLYDQLNPDSDIPSTDVPLDSCPLFNGQISVFHSAIARFYALSDLCGAGGIGTDTHPNWFGQYPQYDTVFIVTDANLHGMRGMVIGRTLLFFSFTHWDVRYSCALVHWLSPVGHAPNDDTGMWVVTPEFERNSRHALSIVHLNCIARAAHLLPVFGSAFLDKDFYFSYSLDSFRAFYVNCLADHHSHEFLQE
ncbi:hypothetical protein B0H10DRAFT_2165190 [Mycena sp. CBHHK59/15]|nr:hypothetical protein B0H10DRAFT_2165190 [Mycena sp. CBHHK59/15]